MFYWVVDQSKRHCCHIFLSRWSFIVISAEKFESLVGKNARKIELRCNGVTGSWWYKWKVLRGHWNNSVQVHEFFWVVEWKFVLVDLFFLALWQRNLLRDLSHLWKKVHLCCCTFCVSQILSVLASRTGRLGWSPRRQNTVILWEGGICVFVLKESPPCFSGRVREKMNDSRGLFWMGLKEVERHAEGTFGVLNEDSLIVFGTEEDWCWQSVMCSCSGLWLFSWVKRAGAQFFSRGGSGIRIKWALWTIKCFDWEVFCLSQRDGCFVQSLELIEAFPVPQEKSHIKPPWTSASTVVRGHR